MGNNAIDPNEVHIANRDFGEGVNTVDLIKTACERAPKMKGIDAQEYIWKLFEMYFGIHDHSKKNPERPLESVSVKSGYEMSMTSYQAALFQKYVNLNVNGVFGMDLLQYLSLPRCYSEIVDKICESHMQQQIEQAEKTEAETSAALEASRSRQMPTVPMVGMKF